MSLDTTNMIGRRVRSDWHRFEGTIKQWEPLGSGMTDTLVETDNGRLCWFAAHELKPIDDKGPLTSRQAAWAAYLKEGAR